jgi:hypothetical protein
MLIFLCNGDTNYLPRHSRQQLSLMDCMSLRSTVGSIPDTRTGSERTQSSLSILEHGAKPEL